RLGRRLGGGAGQWRLRRQQARRAPAHRTDPRGEPRLRCPRGRRRPGLGLHPARGPARRPRRSRGGGPGRGGRRGHRRVAAGPAGPDERGPAGPRRALGEPGRRRRRHDPPSEPLPRRERRTGPRGGPLMGRTTLIEHDVPVEMRDGTVLRADVWRPADAAPSPAVLFRTPYGKSALGLATLTPSQCVDRGYAAVVQDTRGRFASEGEWAPLDWAQEGPDGYDTVEWAARQPWCDGNVAMAGTSYQAIVQWLAAMEKPPHLRAIAPAMSTSAAFDAEQLGGCLRLDHLPSWLGLTALAWVQRRAAAGDPVDAAVVAEVVQLLTTPDVPLRRLPLSAVLDFEGFPGRLRDVFAGKTATVADYRIGDVGVPTFSVGGWYDVFSYGTIELHRAVRAQDPVAGRHELVVGPWVHSGQLPQVQGEVNTGPYGSAQGARLADLH